MAPRSVRGVPHVSMRARHDASLVVAGAPMSADADTTLRISKQAACAFVAKTLLEIASQPVSPNDALLARLVNVILDGRRTTIIEGVEPLPDDVLL